MTFAEYIYLQYGYLRRVETNYRTKMGVERWGAYAIMSASADLKGATVTELLPLPWDKKTTKVDQRRTKKGKLTKREFAQMKREALENIKILEQNGQCNS